MSKKILVLGGNVKTGKRVAESLLKLQIPIRPDDFIWLIKYLFTEVLDGRNESLTNDIEDILNRKPGSFQDYVTKTIKTGIWK